jgi:tetratricopeptide (TPR) repeat protein
MKKCFFSLFIVIICNVNLFPQSKIDSLETRLSQFTESGKEKIELLNKLADQYEGVSPKKTIEYGQQALQLSLELDVKEEEARSLKNIGDGYNNLSDYDKALEYYSKSLKINEKIKNNKGVVGCLHFTGDVYRNLSNYDKALEYYLKALKINDEIGDKKGIAISFNGIGNLYFYINNYDKALDYFQKSLVIREKIGVKKNIAASLNNIGMVYYRLSNYDKTLEYYLKSLEIEKEVGNKNGAAISLNNIGAVYWKLSNYDLSLEYYLKSLKIVKEIGNKRVVAATLRNIGGVYFKLKNYKKVFLYLKQSIKLAKEIEAKDLIKNNYESFSELYSNEYDYKKALEYYKLYTEVKDSIYTKESSDKIAEMQTKYETEKKEKENEILRKNNEIQNLEITRQRNFRNSFIAVSGLILTLVLVIYGRYRSKQNANKILNEKNIQIEKANAQLSDKNKQITEQKNQLSKTLTELRETQKTLVDVAHRAGMAEIATGILHNVGNVLNSVKVSSQILKERIKKSKISGLKNALGLIKEHTTDLGGYITSDEKGKLLPEYLIKVGETLENERDTYLNELSDLHNGIDHIEEIVRVQQDYAGGSGIVESASLSKMMDDVLKMNQDIFNKHKIKVVKHFKETVPISAEKGKLMQVFVNIIKNAWESLLVKDAKDKVITISISEDEENKCQVVDIIDNGIGVAKENLNKIFSYGFTTKKDGKGYGLHTSAIIMAKLNGKLSVHSNKGKIGAKFEIVIPNSHQG